MSKDNNNRKYTKMGAKQKGPNSGETEHRERSEKRGGFKTTALKLADAAEKAKQAQIKADLAALLVPSEDFTNR